jgi:WhiB family redox-sensing transcriptional regulator
MARKKEKYTPSQFSKHMPTPIYDNWAWQEKGLCNDLKNTEIFFYEEQERGPDKEKRISLAVACCNACPVIETCRQFALDTHQDYGIWGGLTEEQRLAIRRKTKVG